MSDDRRTPRRWFRWSLRTMFVVVTILCILTGWIGRGDYMVRQRKALLNRASFSSVKAQTPDYSRLPILWRWLGAEPLTKIEFAPWTPDELYYAVKAAYPETDVTRQGAYPVTTDAAD